MLIVEFCGLPGTGKSTLCNIVEKYCKKSGKIVKNLQLPPLLYKRKHRQINKLVLLLDGDCQKINHSFRKSFFGEINKENLYWLLRIKQNIHIAKQYKKKGLEIATFDEGCVQFISSLFHGTAMNEKKCEFAKLVFDIAYSGYDKILFDCRLNIEENVNRIRHRNRPGDRFLADTDDEIRGRLEIKRSNLDLCISRYGSENVTEIDMLDFNSATEIAITVLEKNML